MTEINDKIKGYIGLCRAAGGVTVGFDLILADVRAKRARLVLVSSDASERTRKQLSDKCSFYSVPCVLTGISSGELGKTVGKGEISALSFNGKGCYNKIAEYFEIKQLIKKI